MREIDDVKAWAAAATPGPWEQGVAYEEAPVNPSAGQWASWSGGDQVEPDLLWQIGHLPVGSCRLCEDGPPLQEETRETTVLLYRTLDRGTGKEFAGESRRRVTFHLHRVARDRDTPLQPISSTSARAVVLGVLTEAGHSRLVLTEADAVFVSRAREAVPRLVAEVERLQALLDERGGADRVLGSA